MKETLAFPAAEHDPLDPVPSEGDERLYSKQGNSVSSTRFIVFLTGKLME